MPLLPEEKQRAGLDTFIPPLVWDAPELRHRARGLLRAAIWVSVWSASLALLFIHGERSGWAMAFALLGLTSLSVLPRLSKTSDPPGAARWLSGTILVASSAAASLTGGLDSPLLPGAATAAAIGAAFGNAHALPTVLVVPGVVFSLERLEFVSAMPTGPFGDFARVATLALVAGVSVEFIRAERASRADLKAQALRAGLVVSEVKASTPSNPLIQESERPRPGSMENVLMRCATRLPAEVKVRVSAEDLAVPAAVAATLVSAVEALVDNAARHAFEPASFRLSAGKPDHGQIEIGAVRRGEGVVISVGDDGRGIDWRGVASKAARLGWPCASSGELEAALMSVGFSLHGRRGAGLGQARAAAEALRGRLVVASTVEGEGTLMELVLPYPLPEKLRKPPARRPPPLPTSFG